jgi:hypothetical protein
LLIELPVDNSVDILWISCGYLGPVDNLWISCEYPVDDPGLVDNLWTTPLFNNLVLLSADNRKLKYMYDINNTIVYVYTCSCSTKVFPVEYTASTIVYVYIYTILAVSPSLSHCVCELCVNCV